MKSLRLLFTEKCNRACKGCCNGQFDLKGLPTLSPKEVSQYETVMITGGEPLLYPDELITFVKYLKTHNPKIYIVIYTAKVDVRDDFLRLLREVDGITLTLHAMKDVKPFIKINDILGTFPELVKNKSMRLNIFKEVRTVNPFIHSWKVKKDMEWIDNCPVPENEVFMRLENLAK